MYRKQNRNQLSMEEFFLPFGGHLSADNRWVKLAKLMPWDMIEDLYAESFVGKPDGRPPISARIAFGAIFIKEQKNLTDRQTVEYTLENPYAQFFLGLSAFRQEPLFDDSMMAHFRYRFTPEKMMKINEELYRRTNPPKPPNDGGNDGTLILDATAAPADVRYPTDLSLLIKEQAGFIKKNLEVLDGLAREAWGAIELKHMERLHTIREILEQQTSMMQMGSHSVANRIVSLRQPHVRPIVRGKVSAPVEFGQKISVSVVNGYTFVERQSWDNFIGDCESNGKK